jgi:hypothetical protein
MTRAGMRLGNHSLRQQLAVVGAAVLARHDNKER